MREQALALAGALQALAALMSVAQRGHARKDEVEPCIKALLDVYEGDLEALYGGRDNLVPGLRLLVEHFRRPTDAALTRYLVAVIYLERKLRKQPRLMEALGRGLTGARRQVEYFGNFHPNVVSNLAGIYSETVSTLRPRIMVQGHREYLEQPANTALIRALLLSAIRAISLWREAGGNRLRLMFGRKQLIKTAEALLQQHP